MTLESQIARLIPIAGISGNKEAETRAASALLAVLSIVRPFSQALFAPLGANRSARAKVEALLLSPMKLHLRQAFIRPADYE